MRPKTWGTMTAPTPPWIARKAMSAPADGASAHAIDASVKPAAPINSIRLRPNMSPRRPPVSSMTAIARV